MFEDSLMESCGQLGSGTRRWIAAASVGLQSLIAVGLIAVPLVHPEGLSFRTLSPVVAVPLVRKPPVVVVERQAAAASEASRFAPPIERMTEHAAMLPSLHPVDVPAPAVAEVGLSPMGNMTGPGSGTGDLLGATGTGRGVTIAVVKPRQTLSISSGVSAGMLLGEIRPVYPRIAVAAHVQGMVVVEATISKAGRIESARVVSGPAMLAGAALDAVRAARYRPYFLNGQATEVQTTVTVNFRLGEG